MRHISIPDIVAARWRHTWNAHDLRSPRHLHTRWLPNSSKGFAHTRLQAVTWSKSKG